MSQDNGLDAQLPISREGLLAALDTAIAQVKSIKAEIYKDQPYFDGQMMPNNAMLEICAHEDYLTCLRKNIRDDVTNHYPPVVRKRFKSDGTLI